MVVGWFGVTKAAFYGEDRWGFSYGGMSGELNFYFTKKFSQKCLEPRKSHASVVLLLLAFITLHCTLTDSAKTISIMPYFASHWPLNCPQRKRFLLHPHYINSSEGRFLVERNIGLFETIVEVLTTCHLVLQMQPHVISFYGVTSRIRFMFLLFPQVSRKWRYESELSLKPSPLTCYRQFGTNSIIVVMFVESQRVHI
jgi:hypothetical protein